MANLGRENETTEFKESTSEFDKACKAIVGILNKSGSGVIYFGVKDNGDVIGQLIGKDTLSNLASKIKDSIRPNIYPTIETLTIDNKDIIKITFNGSNKPYSYKGSFYIRVEQQTLVIDPLVLREIIKSGHEYNYSWERELTNYGMDFVDENTLDAFYRQAVAIGRINKYDHTSEELLTQLGLFVNGKLTNAGYYLFGKDTPLVFKAVEYPTTERINPIDLKRFEGNIFNQIINISNFINQKMKWKVEIDNMKRIEIPEIPIIAIREILINSLIHSDFYGDTDHQITFDPNYIEIYNPGTFGEYTPIDYINDFLPSRTNHKIIQNILYKAFDIETLGRGFKRMDVCCKKENVKWDFRKFPNGFLFRFLRNSDNLKDTTLSKKALEILEYMKNNNNILDDLKSASNIINLKERSAFKYIEELVSKNKIEKIGSRKNGYWKIINS